MKQAETVVSGHLNTSANQAAWNISQQHLIQELQDRARDAGYDANTNFDLAFEPWLFDLNFALDDTLNDWNLIGLEVDKVYTSLLQVPFSGRVQLLIFAVDVQSLPQDEWEAEITVYHIANLSEGGIPEPIFEFSDHYETPLTIQVEVNRFGEELTFAGGLGIDCLDTNICNSIHALTALLHSRANMISEAENVQHLM